jgi:hypothetical protein
MDGELDGFIKHIDVRERELHNEFGNLKIWIPGTKI